MHVTVHVCITHKIYVDGAVTYAQYNGGKERTQIQQKVEKLKRKSGQTYE